MEQQVRVERAVLHACDVRLKKSILGARQAHSLKTALVLEVVADGVSGFGEVSVLAVPNYWHEWIDSTVLLFEKILGPMIVGGTALDFTSFDWLYGNGAARFGIESALADLLAKRAGMGFTRFLNFITHCDSYDEHRRLDLGATLGAIGDWESTLSEIARFQQLGARRVKLKLDGNALLQADFSLLDRVKLSVILDFNGSLGATDFELVAGVPNFVVLEEPFASRSGLNVSYRGQPGQTVLLDESSEYSISAGRPLNLSRRLGIVVKPFRFGSVLFLHNFLELLADEAIPCYLGGMFEVSVGRRVLMSIGTHRCFNMVGDMGPSAWYYEDDIGPPLELDPGGAFLIPGFSLGTGVDELANHDCTDRCRSFFSS